MSVCDVVIMGAMGRMGQTLIRFVRTDPDLRLAGALERSGCTAGLEGLDCAVGDDLATVLAKCPGAVVIDFTSPESTVAAAAVAAQSGNPMVIGTTGLSPDQVRTLEAAAARTPVFFAPNMSVGISVLLQVLPELVRKLGPDYNLEIMEIHHNRKADAPSGTAIKLGQCLAAARGAEYDAVKRHCRDGIIGPRPSDEIGVAALRGGDVVGDHTVYFFGPGERIEVTHRVNNRETFAQGALRAAKWVRGQKPGRLLAMADMVA
ncbi:dihydrodipicolinate reductase [Solidesulfovibrio carbinoliphilus subsp. oakridgensis]|uniref:4-hydroxy-tetrahydrodipicolinate reductase n=1 Tax=Solidesulfovibrio carbinoliphilus subsp. oakridgensis TaxID=694327 RepID=G7Q446_9BACT|nr:4-hydroxy-tetrahydrodipicolinate reductase [Solidesulfovibrio carbinoliphilus]EHJ46836.1 dihydrodipicolinate reductase [Solidesulfovibrio carbinoliphilus subsp. oakridgensis]